jgi:hypothetical protein
MYVKCESRGAFDILVEKTSKVSIGEAKGEFG